jgi:putative transposase
MSNKSRSKLRNVEIVPGARRQSQRAPVTAVAITASTASVTGVDIQAARRAAQIRDTGTEDWQAARGLEADIKQVIAAGPQSKSTIGDLVARWGVSRATAWRRIARYQKSGDLTALLKNPRGLTTGASLLPAQVEAVIQQTAHRLWHLAENASLTDIAPVVQRECRARGLTVPSRATIARRLRPLRTDPEYFSGEAKKVRRDRKRLVLGHYDVASALDVVQIDHTVADVHLVDQHSRAPIGRPTLTVTIDVATRCVMGMSFSLEAPSCLLVALCLEHAVFPKMGSPGSPDSGMNWPMYGRMKAIHSDNGKEFHSVAFHRGCDLNGIDVIYRPPATPRFGGHIERLIGTLMRRVRLLPGNTYSDLLKRRARNPESRATMTMSDLHWFMTEEI